MSADDLFLIFNPIRTEAAEEFEAYVRDVVTPAVASHQPEVLDKVKLWKASEPEPGDEGIIVYAFMVEGVGSWDELELAPAFKSHYGDERAAEALEEFGRFFADHGSWVQSWSKRDVDENDSSQYGWRMEPRSTEPREK